MNCAAEERPTECWAVWISNPSKSVGVWCQQARGNGGFVVWDYHVILLAVFGSEMSKQYLVYDLDTTLPFPCEMTEYLQQAFRPELKNPRLAAFFRVVPARDFLASFSSDRSHMLNAGTSSGYSAEPPVYPCILKSEKSTNNVMNFADMYDSSVPGEVFKDTSALKSFVMSTR
jgi:protein N-terminal glutamine amidohydrolase